MGKPMGPTATASMELIRKSDGKRYEDIAAAVDDIRCPGPCGPDCPLYPLVKLPCAEKAGAYGHMCHPDYYNSHPMTVASALGCSIGGSRGGDADATIPDAAYVAVIRSSAVRDVQFCKDAECDPTEDDAWDDLPDAEVFLGLFSGPDALAKAAEYGNTVPDNVRLIPVRPEGGGPR